MKLLAPIALAALVSFPAVAQMPTTAPSPPLPTTQAPTGKTPDAAPSSVTMTPAPPSAPAAPAAAVNVPKHNCVKPAALTKTSNNEAKLQFNKEIKTYRECLDAYSSEMRRTAEAHISAGNTAIDEYNAFVNAMRDVTK